MEPKSKKNGIKNKSDFKTKLEGRITGSGPRTWPGQAPLVASHMALPPLGMGTIPEKKKAPRGKFLFLGLGPRLKILHRD